MTDAHEPNWRFAWSETDWWDDRWVDDGIDGRTAAADRQRIWTYFLRFSVALAVGATASALSVIVAVSAWWGTKEGTATAFWWWPWFWDASVLQSPLAFMLAAATAAALWWLAWRIGCGARATSPSWPRDRRRTATTQPAGDRYGGGRAIAAPLAGLAALIAGSIGPLWGLAWLMGAAGVAVWVVLGLSAAIILIVGSGFVCGSADVRSWPGAVPD